MAQKLKERKPSIFTTTTVCLPTADFFFFYKLWIEKVFGELKTKLMGFGKRIKRKAENYCWGAH